MTSMSGRLDNCTQNQCLKSGCQDGSFVKSLYVRYFATGTSNYNLKNYRSNSGGTLRQKETKREKKSEKERKKR